MPVLSEYLYWFINTSLKIMEKVIAYDFSCYSPPKNRGGTKEIQNIKCSTHT